MSAYSELTAVLGPTNTGKTHLAVERMLARSSGMIGLPLRLLAREIYDRVVKEKGRNAVALITGEEKIAPASARYFICTVESMPLDMRVAFVAIDEVQLAADPDRGHVFSDRMLNMRGTEETMLLGASTVEGLIRRLVPDADIMQRERFSTLRYAGPAKITKLPRRCAIVAFSAESVYAIAELLRRQRGGAAVVLGALSPRTRNAQVALYQSGEVDYLVATDAIGMGLNMDIDHVAFARMRKFDGRRRRMLDAPEVGQIAGRAGRHMNDGTFGVTNDLGPMTPDLIDAVENHLYKPVTQAFWRNKALDFDTPKLLLRSLQQQPDRLQLVRTREVEDQRALAALMKNTAIGGRTTTRDRVRLLWDVCQIPDFRKVSPDHHAELLAQVFTRLTDGDGVLPQEWIAGQLNRLDRLDGDIDTITTRIAYIRTLAYIAHRSDWLDDAAGWRDQARDLEDRLSDVLHERLIQRFVDRRAAVLNRKDFNTDSMLAGIKVSGEVVVEGYPIGRMTGFVFEADGNASAQEARAILAVAERAAVQDAERRVSLLEAASDADISLLEGGRIGWHGAPVARLTAGDGILKPRVVLIENTLTSGAMKRRAEARLTDWLTGHVQRRLKPLFLVQPQALSGAGRGLLYRLHEGLGQCCRTAAGDQVKALTDADKSIFAKAGIRFGYETVYAASTLKPGPIRTKAALWAAWKKETTPVLPPGQVLAHPVDYCQNEAWFSMGFRRSGPVAIRVDRAERLFAEARRRGREAPVEASASLADIAGVSVDHMPAVLSSFGFKPVDTPQGKRFRLPHQRARRGPDGALGKNRRPTSKPPTINTASPFAKLAALKVSSGAGASPAAKTAPKAKGNRQHP
ncbi:MAG: helicase-related protein [Alphaproteobacteria bacterium]